MSACRSGLAGPRRSGRRSGNETERQTGGQTRGRAGGQTRGRAGGQTGDQAGATLPLTAIALPALLAAVALSLVFGHLFAARYDLWQAADLAALAAARQVSEESLWLGKPSLDAAAARAAAWQALRDNGLSPGTDGITAEFAVAEGRVIHARKAAPEVQLTVCRPVPVPFAFAAGHRGSVTVCATARAAVLRPKRLLTD